LTAKRRIPVSNGFDRTKPEVGLMSRRRAHVLVAGLLTLAAAVFAPPLLGRQGLPPPPPPPPPPPILSMPQEPGAQGQQAAPKGDAIILGQVVDSATGRPVGGASVALTGRPPDPAAAAGRAGAAAPDPNRAFANSEGRFVFRALPKGSYGLTAIAPGYQSGTYGQGRAGGPSRLVEVEDSAAVVTATIKLWKYSSITGTVTDESGEPAVGVQVRALRRLMSGGKPRLSVGFSATTDDRGTYRIPQLTTGDYLIVVPTTLINIPTSTVDAYMKASQAGSIAELTDLSRQYSASGMPFPSSTGFRTGDQQLQITGGRGGGTGLPATLDGPIQSYLTVYHASATVAAQATVITLAPGDERQGVDIQLRLVRTVRVSGTVTGPDGPVANMGVKLVPVEAATDAISDNGFETAITSTDGKGQFTFLAVPTGQYVMKMQRTPPAAGGRGGGTIVTTTANGVVTQMVVGGPSPTSTEPTLWAQQSLTVGDTDVLGVNIGLRTGARISGHVEFEGAAPKPTVDQLPLFGVYAQQFDSTQMLQAPARLDANFQFTAGQYLPGKYFIVVSGGVPQRTLKSVTVSGRDVLLQPFELGSTDLNDVVITYTDQVSDLSGTVRDGGQAVADATVFVFPAEYQTWIANGMQSRFSRTIAPGKTGAFSIRDIPAGAYLAVALPSNAAVDLQDPQWIAKLAVLGTRVTINLGEKKQQDLTVSRIR
jgi:hypothetical protein